mmetsp:Transcript_4393/g.17275  ORF Transcript_4393/g.17275 Transcript_4393/m.17275 type:complete len:301 (+) Transcript_4393:493-1395(+)
MQIRMVVGVVHDWLRGRAARGKGARRDGLEGNPLLFLHPADVHGSALERLHGTVFGAVVLVVALQVLVKVPQRLVIIAADTPEVLKDFVGSLPRLIRRGRCVFVHQNQGQNFLELAVPVLHVILQAAQQLVRAAKQRFRRGAHLVHSRAPHLDARNALIDPGSGTAFVLGNVFRREHGVLLAHHLVAAPGRGFPVDRVLIAPQRHVTQDILVRGKGALGCGVEAPAKAVRPWQLFGTAGFDAIREARPGRCAGSVGDVDTHPAGVLRASRRRRSVAISSSEPLAVAPGNVHLEDRVDDVV